MHGLVKEAVEKFNDPEVKEAARQFYKDNEYAYTEEGKLQALNDIDSIEDCDVRVKVATALAITSMTFEELKGE